MPAAALDDPRLEAPLLPLQDIPSAYTRPRSVPQRPAHRPAHAPFGQAWHAQHGSWSCETSVFPAAYPRSIASGSSISSGNGSNGSRATADARTAPAKMSKADLDKAVQTVFDKQGQARQSPPATTGPNPLWIAVNRYSKPAAAAARSRPSSTIDPVTLVFAHANGFSKETWEPTIARMIASWDVELLGEIEDVLSLDMVNQGDSATINQGFLDESFEWADNGRDILQFILSYLPESTFSRKQSSSRPSATHTSGRPFFYAKDDPSLSHWQESTSSQPSISGNTPDEGANGAICRGVGGYITEDPSLSASARPGSRVGPFKQKQKQATNHFQPSVLQRQALPAGMEDLHLLDASQHSAINAAKRSSRSSASQQRRWRGRRIILVGHSVGAAGMIYCAATFPQLFETLIAVDPTIFPNDPNEVQRKERTVGLATGAVARRDRWKSKPEAKMLFERNKAFYGRWHPEVLESYVDHGLKEADGGQGVTLTVDKMQEAYVFADTDNMGSMRAFYRLARLPPFVNVHIIRADVGRSVIPEECYPAFHEIVKHATHTRIAESAHLVAQEKPAELASEMVAYLKTLERQPMLLKPKL